MAVTTFTSQNVLANSPEKQAELNAKTAANLPSYASELSYQKMAAGPGFNLKPRDQSAFVQKQVAATANPIGAQPTNSTGQILQPGMTSFDTSAGKNLSQFQQPAAAAPASKTQPGNGFTSFDTSAGKDLSKIDYGSDLNAAGFTKRLQGNAAPAPAPASSGRKFSQVQTGTRSVTNSDGSTSTVPVYGNDQKEVAAASQVDAGVNVANGVNDAAGVSNDPVIKQLQQEQARLAKQRDALQAKLDAGTSSGLDQQTQDSIAKQYQQVEDDIRQRQALADSVRDTNKSEATRQYDVAIDNQRRLSAQQDANAAKLAAITGASWSAEGTRGLDEVHAEGQRALQDISAQKANYLSNWQAQADEAGMNYVAAIRANTDAYQTAVKTKYSELVTAISAIDEKSDKNVTDQLKEKKALVKDYLASVDQAAKDARENARFNLDVLKFKTDAIRTAAKDDNDLFDKGVADLGAGLSSVSAADILKGTKFEGDAFATARIQAAQGKAAEAALEKAGLSGTPEAQKALEAIAAGKSPMEAVSDALKASGIDVPDHSESSMVVTAAADDTKGGRECTTYARQQFEKAGFPPILNEGLKSAEDDTVAFKASKVNVNAEEFAMNPVAGAAVAMDTGTRYGHWGIIVGQDPETGKYVMRSSNLNGDKQVTDDLLDPSDPRILGYVVPTADPRASQASREIDETQSGLVEEYGTKGTTAARKKEIERELLRSGTTLTKAKGAYGEKVRKENVAEIEARFSESEQAGENDFAKLDDRAKNQLADIGPDKAILALQVATYELDPNKIPRSEGRTEIVAAANTLSNQMFGKPYEAMKYAEKSGAVSRWKSDSPNVTAYNTVLQHVAELQGFLKEFPSGQIPKWNELENAVRTELGNDKATKLKLLMETIASETAKVYKGNASPTDGDKEEVRQLINSSMSGKQADSFIGTVQHLIGGRINAMAEGYNEAVGRYPKNAMTPETINAVRRLGDPQTMAMARKIAGPDMFTPEENVKITMEAPITLNKDGVTEHISPKEVQTSLSEAYVNAGSEEGRQAVRDDLVEFIKSNKEAFKAAGVDVTQWARTVHMDPQDLVERITK